MSKRIYNVLFHTHTVSGLVISVALFVIFFAGSISFFRDDIINWERDQPIVHDTQLDIDYDTFIDSLEARHELYGRNITLRQIHQERRVMVDISPSQDTTAEGLAVRRAFFYQDPENQSVYSYFEQFTLGEFIYRLHFFAQIPYPYGYLLSGFVAFFFLFAIVTGVIVHWKKIISNFYLFRPWARLKTIWTDAHTALGVIGLPFQFVYAVTGATLIIGTTVMLGTATSFFYDGDTRKLYEDLSTDVAQYPFENVPKEYSTSVNELVEQTRDKWEDINVSKVVLQNHGDANMHVVVEVKPTDKQQFVGLGQVAYELRSGNEVFVNDPYNGTGYLAGAQDVIIKLHYGNFGGYGVKIIYFVFGIITCFVIISGVLIWVEARDKKSNTEWKRKANRWVVSIFLAISLSMYPVTALNFSLVKLFREAGDPSYHLFIYNIYFIPWLLLSVFFAVKRDNYFTNKYNLLLGSILGFIVPAVNGLVSGNWFWKTFNPEQLQIFVVDMFWLMISIITLLIFYKLKPKKQDREVSVKSNLKKPKAIQEPVPQ